MPIALPGSSRASTTRRLAVAAVAAGTIVGGLLVAPAGAQTEPSATAEATCVDGVGVIEVTITDPTESYDFYVFIDDELVASAVEPGVTTVDGLEDGTYAVGVDGIFSELDPIDVLTTDVTVECAAAPTTTTTAPPTTAPPAPAAAPATAARPAASLEFTG